jgi:glycosyltransferase involved in cell wall biosynthesis
MELILAYHGINDLVEEEFSRVEYGQRKYDLKKLRVQPDLFEKQMAYLYYNGYRSITLDKIIKYRRKGLKHSPKSFVITFDDGFRDNFTFALPILKKYGYTATIFLVTDKINESGKNKQYLSWDEIQQMHREGFSFGAHTCSHSSLTQLTIDEAKTEIEESKRTIEENLQFKVNFFSYPYGDFNSGIQTLVEKAGFLGAVVTPHGPGINNGLYSLKRVGVNAFNPMWVFKLKVKGIFSWIRDRKILWKILNKTKFLLNPEDRPIKSQSAKKKILIITGNFPPDIGGPATYLRGLTLALNQRGYPINIIAYGDNKNNTVYPFPVKRISRKFTAPIRLLFFIIYILIKGIRCDVLFVSDYGLPAMLANILLRKRMIIKIVEDFAWEYSIRHNLVEDLIDEFQEKKYSFKIELAKKVRSMYTKNAEKVIVPSKYLKKIVSGWGVNEKKVHVIHNAIDSTKIDLFCTKKEARKQLKLDGKILLSVARLAPWKGIDAVIETLPHLDNEVIFIVIGDGFYLSKLQNQVKKRGLEDRVCFLGALDHKKVFLYMKAADIFILNSGYEGFAHVLLEALIAGVPIIASDKGGNPEIISSGQNGLLVPYNNVDILKKSIIEILNDQKLAEGLINNSRRKAKKFSWELLIKETIGVIEKG